MNYHKVNHRQAEEILSSKKHKRKFKEIESIIRNLTVRSKEKVHDKIKTAFKNKNWHTEEEVSEGTQKKWRYDAFKDRVAVEIDTNTPCYRSFLKFILGYNQGKIDVGVIIVHDVESRAHHKYRRFVTTRKELKDLFSIVPVPIFVMGIYP